MSTAPRVSIGVPAYNAQRYIGATLDSLLAQTFADLEIIICDNCSSDATESICRGYSSRDPRVRYFRNESNLGPAMNYNRCVEHARGEYFKWNAADDLCAPEFVQRCVEVLDRDPSVVLVYPRTRLIDSDGKAIGDYQYELNFDAPSPHVRLLRMLRVDHHLHGAHELYGLMRLAALRKTPLVRRHVRGDSVMLTRLLLLGRFHRIGEYLFCNRDHTNRSSRQLALGNVRRGSRLSKLLGCGPLPSSEWWDPSLRGRIVFPEWRVWREYLRAVQDTDLPADQKAACYISLARFTLTHIPKLARDLIIATEQLVNWLLGVGEEPERPEHEPDPVR